MPIRDYYQQHKSLVIIAIIILVALVAGGYIYKGRSTQVSYLTAPVTQGDIRAVVQATGTINPLTTVPVGSYVSGTVLYIFADFNSRVHAGQVLAQLDPAIYEAQTITARGNLANAEANIHNLQATIAVDVANLAKAKANEAYSAANGRRIQQLLKEGVISADQNDLTQSTLLQSQAEVQAAEAAINQAKAQLESARAQVEAQRGNLKQAETNLRYTTILSPIDGTVVSRNITVGQSVAASLQAPNVFSIAQDLKRMQVYAKTDESDTGSVKVGTDVTFQVDAFPTEQFHGRVSTIRLDATTVQNVVTYDTVIDFENPDEKLLPGETAYVTIPTGVAKNTLEIPNAALTFTPSDIPRQQLTELYNQYKIKREAYTSHLGGWQVVWKLGADKKPAPVGVRIGITDYVHSQLLEGDLQEGDKLVTGQESGGSKSTSSSFPGGPRVGGGQGGGGPRR
jgi:HlyD family secretion protein